MNQTLRDPSLLVEAALVAGDWVQAGSEELITVRNPSTGDVVGQVPRLTAAATRQAIAGAKAAQPEWAARSNDERARILRRWFDLVMANQDDLGLILTLEQGKPLAEAKGEIAYGASFIEWFAEEARRIEGEILPGDRPNSRMLVLKQAVGVVAAITPWNFPNAMVTRKVAPALATGCAVVLKPASQTPFSALALALLAERAGVPKGLFSVVTGSAAEIGDELTVNIDVRKLSFTGSTEIGAALMAQCAPTIKKLSLELGGNAPFIIFDDADIAAAVKGTLVAKFRNNGQTCVCANRILVHENVHDAYVAQLAAAMSALQVGDGLTEGVTLGPLVDVKAVAKVESHIADAVAKGAKVVTGGNHHALGGNFFEPTVLTGMTDAMLIARDETFGPVAAVFRFSTDAEAIAMANDTEFGLASYIYTKSAARQWSIPAALEYGMVGVNTGLISNARAPFGGVKLSGLGREGSRHGMDDYLELKYVCLDA